MVNVAGRSKGCHTCKKRRVKCDESRPNCDRCWRAGFKCGGYDRDVKFHNATIASQGRYHIGTKSSQSEAMPPEMRLLAFKPEIQYAFLFKNFVWASYGSPWLAQSARGEFGELSQRACSALSYTTFGRYHCLRAVEVEGSAQYGQTLAMVRARLENTTSRTVSDVLAPTLVLLLYSSSSPSVRIDGRAHIMGLIGILKTCGPEAFQNPWLRSVFSSCRATMATIGLVQKKRLFLEDGNWRSVPWARQSDSKSSQDQLVDIMVMLPGLFEDRDALDKNADPDAKHLLVSSVRAQLACLFQWCCNWNEMYPCVAWEEQRCIEEAAEYGPLPDKLLFSNFSRAVELALHDAILLCLLGLLRSQTGAVQAMEYPPQIATNDLKGPAFETFTLLPSSELLPLRVVAIEIVRTFEFQLSSISSNINASALFWLFPLGLASKVLRSDEVMTSWINKLLDQSEVTRGYGRGDNLFGFGFYEFPTVAE